MPTAASGTRLPLAAWLALGCGALALAALHTVLVVVQPDAAWFSFDSAEYALAGRSWLEYGRLTTPFVHPSMSQGIPGPPFPLLVGHPLVPALDAVAFALAGREAWVSVLPSLLAMVATVLGVARLTLACCGSRGAALAAGAAFAASPWALRFASEGLSELPFAAILTWAFVLLWQLPERPRAVRLGVLLGLAQLARPVLAPMLVVLLPAVLALAPRGRRMRTLAGVLLSYLPLAALVPLYKWLAAGGAAAGSSSYLLLTGVTPEFVVARLNRMASPPDALAWIAAHPALYAEKLVRNLRSLAWGVWQLAGRWPVLLAALTVLAGSTRGNRHTRVFLGATVAATLLVALLAAATVADPRMLFPFVPLAVGLAFAGVARAAETLSQGRRSARLVAVVLLALLSLPALAREWRGAASLSGRSAFHEREWRGLGRELAPLLPAGGLVASDAAPWIAWHTGHPVTLIPLAPSHTQQVGAHRVDAVVVTNEWLIRQPGETAWREVFERRAAPAGFQFAAHVRSGNLEAMVFTRPPGSDDR